MALALTIDKLEDVAEPLREFYKEGKDGKFVLDAPVEDYAALKRGIATERTAREKAEANVRAWAKLGKTPDEIEDLLKKEAEEAEKRAKQAGDWESMRKQLNDQHARELQAEKEKSTGLSKRLEQELIDARATAAIAAAQGDPILLLPHVKRFVKVDDHLNPQVVDAGGTPRVDGSGNPLTIAALIDEMKQSETYARAFLATESGGGSRNVNGGDRQPLKNSQVKRKSDLKTKEARAEYLRTQGEDAWLALPN